MKIIRNKQFALYTTKAIAQFKMAKLVDRIAEDTPGKEGSSKEGYWLFVDAAKTKADGSREGDWKNKISIRLGIPDIGVFLNGFRLGFDATKLGTDYKGNPKKFDIYHDPGKGGPSEGKITKGLEIAKAPEHGYFLHFRTSVNGTKSNFSVPVTDEQMIVLKLLLEQAAILITGFYDDGVTTEVKSTEAE